MMSTSVVIVWSELSLESKVPEMGKVNAKPPCAIEHENNVAGRKAKSLAPV